MCYLDTNSILRVRVRVRWIVATGTHKGGAVRAAALRIGCG